MKDVSPSSPDNILEPYNPPLRGRALYFTEHGGKIRNTRKFTIDEEKDTPSTCNKKYPVVGKKGTTYLFLWFCGLHGHCYGYHMIPHAEGTFFENQQNAESSIIDYYTSHLLLIYFAFAQ